VEGGRKRESKRAGKNGSIRGPEGGGAPATGGGSERAAPAGPPREGHPPRPRSTAVHPPPPRPSHSHPHAPWFRAGLRFDKFRAHTLRTWARAHTQDLGSGRPRAHGSARSRRRRARANAAALSVAAAAALAPACAAQKAVRAARGGGRRVRPRLPSQANARAKRDKAIAPCGRASPGGTAIAPWARAAQGTRAMRARARTHARALMWSSITADTRGSGAAPPTPWYSRTHARTHKLSHMHARTQTLSANKLSHTHARTQTLSHVSTHTNPLTRTHARTQTLSHARTHAKSLSLSHARAQTLSRTHAHTNDETNRRRRRRRRTSTATTRSAAPVARPGSPPISASGLSSRPLRPGPSPRRRDSARSPSSAL
jgi:hypothetical protein